jgi:hypothetical protein
MEERITNYSMFGDLKEYVFDYYNYNKLVAEWFVRDEDDDDLRERCNEARHVYFLAIAKLRERSKELAFNSIRQIGTKLVLDGITNEPIDESYDAFIKLYKNVMATRIQCRWRGVRIRMEISDPKTDIGKRRLLNEFNRF